MPPAGSHHPVEHRFHSFSRIAGFGEILMAEIQSVEQLCSVRCVPCEGGVPKMTAESARSQLDTLPGWELLDGPDRIRKTWTVKNFAVAMDFFRSVADLSESEGHHPDLHLTAYRNVAIEIWTHAIGGLSINDFILAAKIDRIAVQRKSQSGNSPRT
jgi:4a-hydroxytetrahydrobiopterin dehydratase